MTASIPIVMTAPLPPGINGHFGPQLRRFVLAQYRQGQTTVPRLVTLLRGLDIAISKREVVRLLTATHDGFRDEARDVLRVGLANSPWITVDDTGRAPSGEERFLHPDRQRALHRLRHHCLEEPLQLPRPAARRP